MLVLVVVAPGGPHWWWGAYEAACEGGDAREGEEGSERSLARSAGGYSAFSDVRGGYSAFSDVRGHQSWLSRPLGAGQSLAHRAVG